MIFQFASPRQPASVRIQRWTALCLLLVATGVACATDPPKTAAEPGENSVTQTAASDSKPGSDWVRLQRGASGDVTALQTAIVRYRAADNAAAKTPAEVDLIGAIHIADAAYYRQLNDRFKQYDALLYELVAPEGTVVQRGRGASNAHPVSAMQNGFKELLDLDHQLDGIDYTQPNFVHADMSPDEFAQAMKDRNESFLQMIFKLMGAAIAQQSELNAKGESPDVELFAALFAKDRPRRLKIVMAKQLSQMQGLLTSFGGEEGSVIISERNKRALAVLKQQLAAGKLRVGIFYGAGHLTDMDKRLRDEFHMQPVSITWLTAWNLSAKP